MIPWNNFFLFAQRKEAGNKDCIAFCYVVGYTVFGHLKFKKMKIAKKNFKNNSEI